MKFIQSHLLNKLLSLNLIKQSEIPIFNYGLDVLISSTINILTISGCALLFNSLCHGLVFLFTFIPLRVTLGGFHATTRLRCFVTGIFLYGICSFINYCLCLFTHIKLLLVVLLVLNTIYIILCKPVKNANHPICNEKLNFNKQLSSKFMTAEFIFCLIGIILFPVSSPMHFSVFALSAVVILHFIALGKGGEKNVIL